MYQKFLAANRPHFKAIVDLHTLDVPLRAASGVAICLLVAYLGHPVAALILGSTILLSESILFRFAKQRAPFEAVDRDQILIGSLVACFLNSVLYAWPNLYLASSPSIAIKFAGMVWLMGMHIHIINLWSRFPYFLFAMLIPAMVMFVLCFLRLGGSDPVAATVGEWWIATVIMVLFVYVAVDTLRKRLTTEDQLEVAQREAHYRLKQLEDAHRLDTLTNLLNRSAFDRALGVMLNDRETSGGEICVVLLDLNGFKPINDTYSHDAGDAVLVHTALQLKRTVGAAGVVARRGGDEFICALHGINDKAAAMAFAADIADAISHPVDWNGRVLKTGASIGVVLTGDSPSAPPCDVASLCAAADQAMFKSKSSASDRPVFYQSHQFEARMNAEDKLALIQGIADRSVKPYYQPKVHLPSGNIIGFEALARWDHPDGITRTPGAFLFQIDELGLQGDFMMSMAHQVVEDIAQMLAQGLDPGQVSVNVSEVALATHTGRKDLLAIVASNPDVAAHLTLEITEDVFIARAADRIQASIKAFRALGVRISLDDFGTGFASFNHLRQLDFDELKIDTSFVAGLGKDHTSDVLVRGFLDIAAGLGVTVMAEGVETETQRRQLIDMGCFSAQGYLFSAAVPFGSALIRLNDQQAA